MLEKRKPEGVEPSGFCVEKELRNKFFSLLECSFCGESIINQIIFLIREIYHK